MNQITKIVVCWEMYLSRTPASHIAEHLQVSRDTVHRWTREIKEREGRPDLFLDDYLVAKKGQRRKRKIDGLLRKRVWQIREDNKDCCGQKVQYHLEKDHGIRLGVTTIYKILAEKYILRTKWKKNQKRGPVPEANRPRQVVQMDTVDFGEVFAFCGIDVFTKEVDVLLRPSLTSRDGYLFLKQAMEGRFDNFVELIQTDGGPEFKDEFKQHVLEYADRHRIARSYKKNEQAFVESFNRTLRKECLGWAKYKTEDLAALNQEVRKYLAYYHTKRPHLSLGMRPPLEK